jgi:hypothetical protein
MKRRKPHTKRGKSYGKKASTASKRSYSKISRTKKPKKIISSYKRRSRKTSRKKTQNRGNSVSIRVRSKVLNKSLTIVRKKTDLAKGIRLNKRSPSRIIERLTPIAEKHSDKIGKSYKDLKYVKIKYTTKINGKKITSYFSTKVAKIKNKKQLKRMIELTVESFASRLDQYLSRGFSDITVKGITVQGYKK